MRIALGFIWRPALAAWRRARSWNWDRVLQRTAHASQFVLVVGGIWGYFYTVRPINQKEQLEEDIVEARHEVAGSRKEAARLQTKIANFNSKIGDLERASLALNAEIQEARHQVDLQAEQTKQQVAALRENFSAERLQLIAEQEQFRKRMAAEKVTLATEFAEQLRSAEQRATAAADEKHRMQTFNSLRSLVVAQCLAPRADMFYDVKNLAPCISTAAQSMTTELTQADNALILAWAEREAAQVELRAAQDPDLYSALGRLVVDETFSASTTCTGPRANSGEIIELRLPEKGAAGRCIGSETMSITIGSFVARYGGLQWAVEAAISGAAERRDPTRFALPNPPSSVTAQ